MMNKMLKAMLVCAIVLASIGLFAEEFWDKEESGTNQSGYVSDSGSFALLEDEFTKIKVKAILEDGDGNYEMSAVAHIQVGSYTAHVEVEDDESTPLQTDSEYPSGTGSCNSWYWTIDTGDNSTGTGSAWCYWRWSRE